MDQVTLIPNYALRFGVLPEGLQERDFVRELRKPRNNWLVSFVVVVV